MNRYGLSDEFRNLNKLSGLTIVSKVYAFGRCGRFPVKEELLAIEYFPNSKTVDEMASKYPFKKRIYIREGF